MSAAVLSPNGAALYLPEMGTDTVAVATIDPLSGGIQATTNFPAGVSGAADIALAPSGQFAYMLGSASNNIVQHLMDPVPGSWAAPFGAYPAGSNGRRLRMEPHGRFLYAPSYNGTLYAFAIDGTSGALTPVLGSPFPAGNGNVAIAIVEPKP